MTPSTSVPDPALSDLLTQRLALVEERLQDAVTHADELADTTSRHLVNAGGKRLRPLLTLLCAQLGEGHRPEVIDAAVVVELTHLATLYHDDVMDSAPLRRGAPAAHEVWGNSVAILTGDLLFARASMTVAGLGPDAVRIQAQTFERLCLGQLHETVGPKPTDDPVAHYIQVLSDKTASLLATSALFGAKFAGCGADVGRIVAAYGEKLGVAFQLADDVIDLAPSGDTTGKTPGTDLREQVATMPVLLLQQLVASEQGTVQDRELLALLEADLTSDDALDNAVRALRAHEVVAQTHELATSWAQDAVAEISDLPTGTVKDAMMSFAAALVERAA